MDTLPKILVVNGPPGSGKSFSREMAQRLLMGTASVYALELRRGTGLEALVRELAALLGVSQIKLPDADFGKEPRGRVAAETVARLAPRAGVTYVFECHGSAVSRDVLQFLESLVEIAPCRLILIDAAEVAEQLKPGTYEVETLGMFLPEELEATIVEYFRRRERPLPEQLMPALMDLYRVIEQESPQHINAALSEMTYKLVLDFWNAGAPPA